ncbi:MAG: DUF4468 domain-containing protein [Prevotella sp.]|nr:DUF4468 domain-containing protein [Prevotella sp.]
MRKLFFLIAFFCHLGIFAQTVWDKPDIGNDQTGDSVKIQKEAKVSKDEKYLEGAVPEIDGKVEWTLELDVPGKDAVQIYDIMLACFSELTKSKNQLEGSSVSLVSKQDHIVVASVKEWLMFRDNVINLDRTKFYYTLMANCYDNRLKVTMNRIAYKYDEENGRGGYFYNAEDWINDKNALNKKKTKLLLGSAKFRRKTVDRKDEVFDMIRLAVSK